MKKIVLLLISLAMVFGLCACSGGSSDGSGKSGKVADDTSVMGMGFALPENYETVERYCEFDREGNLIEKDITYTLTDGKTLGYAYTPNSDLSELIDFSSMDSVEQGGKTCYFYPNGDDTYVFIPADTDFYAIPYTGPAEELKEIIKSLSFTDAKETVTDDTGLGTLSYSFENEDNIYSRSVRVSERKASGTIETKSVQYYFGENEDSQEYRIFLRQYRNRKIEDILDPERNYEEREINGISYTAHISDNYDKPYNYYTQQGNDVYQLANNGTSGLFTSRSEESFAAFEAFLNTVSFK